MKSIMIHKIQGAAFILGLSLLCSLASGEVGKEFRVDYEYNQDVTDSLSLIEKDGHVIHIDSAPSGKFLVYSRDESMYVEGPYAERHIWLLDLATLTKTDLTHDKYSYSNPVFLDEFTIAFSRFGDKSDTIFTLDLRTKESKQIIPQEGSVVRGSQDKILFYPVPTGTQNLSPLAPYNIWLLNRDGSNPVQLTNQSHPRAGRDFIYCCPSLGLNGTKILFMQGDGLWTMDLIGKNKSRIINESVSVSDFSASRTGIAFRRPSDARIWFISNLDELNGEITGRDVIGEPSNPSVKNLGSFWPEPLDYVLSQDNSALFFVGTTPQGNQGIYMLKLKSVSQQNITSSPTPLPTTPTPRQPGFEFVIALTALLGAFLIRRHRRPQ